MLKGSKLMLNGSKLMLKGSKLLTLLHEDRTYPCQFISIMLLELVSTTAEVKHGDSQLTTDHHHFSSSPPAPNPKQRQFGLQQQSTLCTPSAAH
jgi:hypothetical protein